MSGITVEIEDRVYDPMIYDAMRELANQATAQYLEWEINAEGAMEQYWQNKRIAIFLAVRAVNPDSHRDIAEMTNRLRHTLRRMQQRAPIPA